MHTKIRKWGNSLGLRIPKAFAEEAHLTEGASVDISLEGDALVVRAVRAPYRLADLVSEVREENIHYEVDTGDAVGREAW